MNALLDTHAVLWSAYAKRFLSTLAAKMIADEQNVLYISAASAWEIATKVRIGKLPEAIALEKNFLETTTAAGYRVLPITPELALLSGRLAGRHGDPFDRVIAAQALVLDIPVISNDAKLDEFGVRRIW